MYVFICMFIDLTAWAKNSSEAKTYSYICLVCLANVSGLIRCPAGLRTPG